MENEQPPETKQGLSNDAAALVLHRWQEEERLSRFFTKLCGEVIFLGADRVEFRLEGDALSGTISKQGHSLKSLTLKGVWFEPMHAWLTRNRNTLAEMDSPSPLSAGTSGLAVGVRCNDTIVGFRVDRAKPVSGTKTLVLRDFSVMNWERVVEILSVMPYSRGAFEDLFGDAPGVVVAVVPPATDVAATLSTFLVLGAGTYLGELEGDGVRAAICSVAPGSRVVVSIVAADVFDVLSKITAWRSDPALGHIKGVASLAFARRVCSTCAKASRIVPDLFKVLPDYFHEFSVEKYAVGRGCDACGHQGYRGIIGLQSLARFNRSVVGAISEGRSEHDFVSGLYDRGLKPLLEDGFCKAVAGLTTVESILAVSRHVPQTYVELRRQRAAQAKDQSSPSEPSQSVRGDGPDRSAEVAPTDSARLFKSSLLNKRREKPLLLVVEDDADQRAILEMVFKGAEYDVACAANGSEALEAVDRDLPDLVISDLMMPVMDGSELVGRLKGNAKFSRLPILMLTMVADEEREYALLNLGADDYCDKTIQRKVLLQRVENLLRRSGAVD